MILNPIRLRVKRPLAGLQDLGETQCIQSNRRTLDTAGEKRR